MKNLISLIFVGFALTGFSTSYHTISIEGTNSGWSSDETFTDVSSADNYYITWDADYIYIGISDAEADYGNLATFVYFDTDPTGSNGTTNAYAWSNNITTPFNADYVVVWKNQSSSDYIEVRNYSGASWNQVASANSTSLNSGNYVMDFAIGTDYRECRIKLTTIGSPSMIKVCTFTEQQYGSYWRYFGWPSSGWTDGNRGSQSFSKHYAYVLEEDIDPNDANYLNAGIRSWDDGAGDGLWASATNWTGNTAPTSTDIAVIDGSYNVTIGANANCVDLFIGSSATLTLNNSYSLSVGNNFRISSDASNTGAFVDANAAGNLTVTGTATVERYATGGTLGSANGLTHFVSSPVSDATGATLFDASKGSFNMYTYGPTQSWSRVFSGTSLSVGKGYMCSYNANKTITFSTISGSLNTGNKTVTISGTNGDYTLIGNPYPSPVNSSSFINGANNPNFNGTIYFFDQSTAYDANDYASYNGTGTARSNGGGTTPGDYLAVGQGFFVESNASGTTVSFNQSWRTAQNPHFFVPDPVPVQRFRFSVTNPDNQYNEILIGFLGPATAGKDHMYDGHKLQGNPNLSFYSKLVEDDGTNENYVIQGLPPLTGPVVVPLGLYTALSGEMTFKVEELENFDADIQVILVDEVMQQMIDLRKTPGYVFTAEAGDIDNRFAVHFYRAANTGLETESNENFNVYSYSRDIFVNVKSMGNTRIRILGVNGQCMIDKTIGSPGLYRFGSNLPTGIYFVMAVNDSETIIRKVVKK